MSNVNKDIFEELAVPVAARKLMIPTIIGSLVMVIYSMADTFFVGLMNDEIQSAAVALAAPALMAFNAVNNLFGVGTSSMMSRSLGKGDIDMVRKSASFGFYGAVGSGALLSILCFLFLNQLMTLLGVKPDTMEATAQYMQWAIVFGAVPTILNVVMAYFVRSEGASLHASIGTMSGCILNMILDPIFILPWGLNMGAAGAGMATCLSNCFACLYFFVLIIYKKEKTNIKLHPKYFGWNREVAVGIASVGIPASIQNLLNVTGMTIMNNFVAGYGPAAMAALGIAQKINMVPIQIALGGTQGIMPLVGYSYANQNAKRFEEVISFVRKLLLPGICVVSIACWVFSPWLVGLFIKSQEVVFYGKWFLRGLSAALPFMFLDFLTVGIFQSIGMGKKSLIFAILRKIILEIPAIMILNAIFHEYGITYAGFVAELFLAAYGTYLTRRIITDFQKKCKLA